MKLCHDAGNVVPEVRKIIYTTNSRPGEARLNAPWALNGHRSRTARFVRCRCANG